MQIKHIIITLLFLTSAIFYYQITLEKPIFATAQVVKVIDGDTLQLDDTTKVRLLGINTPESTQPYYEEAKAKLNFLTNQTVQIESHGQDKYGRTLAYIFHNSSNFNEVLLLNGLATLYYYEKDSHYKKLKEAEDHARKNQILRVYFFIREKKIDIYRINETIFHRSEFLL